MLFTMPSWKQMNPPYKFKWTEKTVPVAEGSSETTTEGYMENYKNVSQDIRNQLDAEAEAVQIILTGIKNDIYSTIDACPNACEMFYKMKNKLVRNQCDVTNHQVNVQFLLQLQPEWQRFVTHVKQSQELKAVSYHKFYDILKQHQNEVNELRAERLARTANPLALVAHQQPVYHPQNNPNYYTQNSLTKSQQAATRNKGVVNVAGARENVEQTNWRDDTNDEPDNQELEVHYMYMAQIQEVTLDAADNSGPIFDTEPLQKIQNDDDKYNVFSNDREHPEQPEYVNETYLEDQGDTNITTDSLDMSNREKQQPHTSLCDFSMNIRNAQEELHNFVDKVLPMLIINRLDIIKLIASVLICPLLYLSLFFHTLCLDEHGLSGKEITSCT
ncbi:hypothetical protein Tco_0003905 [Tanacetum coccineum]